MKRGDFLLNILRVPVDFGVLVGAGAATYVLRTRVLDAWRPVLFGPDLPFERFMTMALMMSALFVFVYAISGLYAMKSRLTVPQESARIIVASSAAMMVVILVIFVRAEGFNSRFLVLGYWAIATFATVVGRFVLRAVFHRLTVRYDFGTHRILLIGNDDVTNRLAETMRMEPWLGYRVVCEMPRPDLVKITKVTRDCGIDEIMLATPDYPAEYIVPLVDFCHEQHLVFRFVPNIYRTLTTHYDVDAIGRIPLVQLRRTALDGWGRVFKRTFDIVGSFGALVVLSPVFAMIAFAIKWETYGPVFVRLKRVSRGQEFDLLKFRSMIDNAEDLKPYLSAYNERDDGPLFKMHNDPRITRVGRIIRKCRLDELPQFWNVLCGDMSLVGPRPHQPDEIAQYTKHHRGVMAIKAGATGLPQVSGASDLPFEEEVALDTFYIENWSLMLDIRIALKTVRKFFGDHSAV